TAGGFDRMKTGYDVAVVGLGAAGSAALYQLARRGVKAVGMDRFDPPHEYGSSHGDTRITRLALGEGPQYAPLVRRSHEIWRELEATTGRTLLRQVGALIYGSTQCRAATHGAEDFLETTIKVARSQGIDHEELDAAAMRERFPQFRFGGDESGYFESEAGLVHPAECISAQLEMARRMGAEVRTGERIVQWKPHQDRVVLTTGRGVVEAEKLIMCAGAWMPSLLPELRDKARVFRQVLFWFEPDGPHEMFMPDRMPVHIRVPDSKTGMFYGFPAINGPGGGMKVAGEQFDLSCDPDEMVADVSRAEAAAMFQLASPHLRIRSNCLRSVACKYTVTADFAFIIDRHPSSDRVWLASPCSGHGFKHSAAVGEALAEWSVEGVTRFDLSSFALERFKA
ncbi:MAG TPA: N-methyl-L-tryptophan oxidase, partial [Verrucomicrobiaceae bacterium]